MTRGVNQSVEHEHLHSELTVRFQVLCKHCLLTTTSTGARVAGGRVKSAPLL